MHRQSDFDAASFWKVLEVRLVAVPVVTACDSNGPAGLLALSATHVSAMPPTMFVAIGNSTSALTAVFASNAFAINYLPESASEVADTFGGKRGLHGSARFDTARWTTLTTGSPVLAEAVLALDCKVIRIFAFEETQLVVGRVVDCITNPGKPPLVFSGGRYQVLAAG